MICKVCYTIIEPDDSVIKCCVCDEVVHQQCRGLFNTCDICTDEILANEKQEMVKA